jgi:hypothetical protein
MDSHSQERLLNSPWQSGTELSRNTTPEPLKAESQEDGNGDDAKLERNTASHVATLSTVLLNLTVAVLLTVVVFVQIHLTNFGLLSTSDRTLYVSTLTILATALRFAHKKSDQKGMDEHHRSKASPRSHPDNVKPTMAHNS